MTECLHYLTGRDILATEWLYYTQVPDDAILHTGIHVTQC